MRFLFLSLAMLCLTSTSALGQAESKSERPQRKLSSNESTYGKFLARLTASNSPDSPPFSDTVGLAELLSNPTQDLIATERLNLGATETTLWLPAKDWFEAQLLVECIRTPELAKPILASVRALKAPQAFALETTAQDPRSLLMRFSVDGKMESLERARELKQTRNFLAARRELKRSSEILRFSRNMLGSEPANAPPNSISQFELHEALLDLAFASSDTCQVANSLLRLNESPDFNSQRTRWQKSPTELNELWKSLCSKHPNSAWKVTNNAELFDIVSNQIRPDANDYQKSGELTLPKSVGARPLLTSISAKAAWIPESPLLFWGSGSTGALFSIDQLTPIWEVPSETPGDLGVIWSTDNESEITNVPMGAASTGDGIIAIVSPTKDRIEGTNRSRSFLYLLDLLRQGKVIAGCPIQTSKSTCTFVGTPLIENGRVYALECDYSADEQAATIYLCCFAIPTGTNEVRIEWRTELFRKSNLAPAQLEIQLPVDLHSSSGELVVCSQFGFVAVLRNDGSTIWHRDFHVSINSQTDHEILLKERPSCSSCLNGNIVFSFGLGRNLLMLDQADGEVLWSRELSFEIESLVIQTQAVVLAGKKIEVRSLANGLRLAEFPGKFDSISDYLSSQPSLNGGIQGAVNRGTGLVARSRNPRSTLVATPVGFIASHENFVFEFTHELAKSTWSDGREVYEPTLESVLPLEVDIFSMSNFRDILFVTDGQKLIRLVRPNHPQ